MSNSFKKTFFSSLLAVLVIISNLIGIKYTNFGSLILSVNFVTFPFIFLCFLLIMHFSNKKEAFSSLLSAVFIQIFILLSYVLVTNLGSQNVIPDFANYVNGVFKVDEVYILINLVSLMGTTYVFQYIYEYFRIIGYKLLGVSVSLLTSITLYGLITIPIINYDFGLTIILDIIMSHLLMSCFMTVLLTILFYLLKDKEYPYDENKIFINEIEVPITKEKIDKPIDEVIKIAEKNVLKDKPRKTKTSSSKRKKSSSATNKQIKKSNSSKKDVKK